MTPFTRLTATAAPLLRENIDTDAIIPSREMTSVSKRGLADGLFAGWRYTHVGGREPDPDFILNDPRYADARILLAGGNFGCGSSREHAAWALAEYGFRAIVASGFNPIFHGNCARNGIVPVMLPDEAVSVIADHVAGDPARRPVTVDLEAGTVSLGTGEIWSFALDDEAREMLLHGLDAIELTYRRREEIAAFRRSDRAARPWAYLDRQAAPRA